MRKISIIRKIPVIAFIASFIVCISAFIVLPSTAEYKISYNLDGGAFESQTKTKYTSTDHFSISNPVKKGYEFLGWTGSNGDTPQLSLGSVYGKTGDKSYTANWKLITYSVTYNLDGGFVSGNPTYYNINSMFRLYEPVKSGYIFLGWTGSNGDTPMRDVLVKSGNTGNLEFTANWEYIQTYSITYNLNGGSVSGNPTSYNKFSNTITLNTPTRSGYYFLGWTGSNGSNPEKSVTIPSGSTGNKTYTANWIQTYSISYNLNGGFVFGNPTSFNKYSSTITLNSPTRSGYEFLGWTGSNGSTPEKSVTIYSGSTGDKTYTANWKVIKYTITYKLDGGENSKSNIQEYTIETSFTFISPTKQYYTFMGWYKDANFQSKINSISKGTIGDIVLYAKWELINYTITYYLNGGINNKDNLTTFTVNDLPIKLSSPSLKNTEFYGWKEKNSNNNITEISSCENYYLYATWGETYILSEDKTYYMVSGKSCSLKEVVINESYNGLPVKSIVEKAFSGYSRLTSITIPDSVTSIGSSAFYNCSSLTGVYYTGTIENWCNITFSDYSSNPMVYASHFYIKNSNGEYEELTKIEIPNTITEIKDYAFSGFNNVTRVTIPDSVTSIGGCSFSGCSSLTSITIPSSVTSIGKCAFDGCSSLTSITIPDSVTSIGNYTFSNCSSLQYNVYDNAKYLGNNENPYLVLVDTINEDITTCTINSNTKVISNSVFGYCRRLRSITIPNSVTSIGSGEFYNCSSLTSVYYTGTIENWCNITFSDGYSNPMSNASQFYIKNSNGEYEELTEIEIPNNIIEIKDRTFYGFKNVTKVTISNSVTSIGNGAFSGCRGLTSITIGDSVTSIGNGAFSGCSRLTSITIGNSVTSIGSSAFRDCSSLTSITIGNSVTSIGSSAFRDCSSLTSITIPNSVTGIGDSAFWNCSSLISITIGNGVTSIGSSVFYYCRSLTNITIPNSVTSIGDFAFSDCSGLTSIIIPDSVTSIGSYAFSGCSCLTSITIPNSVTSIGNYAFYGCSSLTSITIPNRVTSIGWCAFDGCSGLTSITIGNSVTSIGDDAFEDCSSLKYNIYDNAKYLGNNENPYLVLVEAINKNITTCTINSNTRVIYGYAFYNCSSLTSIIIPDSVTSIGDSAFEGCSSLTSITIPNSVTSIGYSAFSGCSSLKYNIYDNAIYLGNDENPYLVLVEAINKHIINRNININTRFIHSDAFKGCSGLTSITIPDSVTSIGIRAFSGCSSLISITIGNSVTRIGGSVFDNCNSLTNVYYTGTIENWCNITFSGNDSNPMCYASHFYIKNSNGEYEELTEIEIPNTVTKINDYAFYKFKNVTKVTIPNSVTSIGYSAFSGCSGLTSITIPNSVTSIGGCAFQNCNSLTSITIPNSVTSIGYSAFQNCNSLTSVTIGNSVTSIGGDAFSGCRRLSTVYYKGGEKDWNSISIGFGNEYLIKVTIYYYSETKPSASGNYWHYNTSGEIEIW